MQSELFVSRTGDHTWAVLREDGAVVEVRLETHEGQSARVGWVAKGKVTNVLPGIQAAFVDVGIGRDGFLHVDDLIVPSEEHAWDIAQPVEVSGGAGGLQATGRRSAGAAMRSGRTETKTAAPIEERLRPGDTILVQIARDAIRAKGPRLSCYVTLPGRYLAYLPHVGHRAISRRIRDLKERDRLQGILDRLPDGGFIVRTAGLGAEESAFQADTTFLAETWREILRRAEQASAPAVLHRDVGLCLRLIRDCPADGLLRIVVDNAETRDRALDYLRRLEPSMAAKIHLHTGPPPLLEAHGLEQEIEKVLRPKVWLRSGGYLVIEPTEALVSIDVNTGKYVGERAPEETVLRTNLEAAVEIARQLRLRDLGGIIVVDFIDMARPENRRKILETLELALRKDPARTKIVGLSELGLLQLTRKRTQPGLAATVTRPCPACSGLGRVKTPEAVAAEVMVEVQRLLPSLDDQPVTVRAHPEVARAVRSVLQHDPGTAVEATNREILVEEDPAVQPDRFDVIAW